MEAFSERFGLACSTIGQQATKDTQLYARLYGGGWCSPRVEKRVMDWMAADAERRLAKLQKDKSTEDA